MYILYTLLDVPDANDNVIGAYIYLYLSIYVLEILNVPDTNDKFSVDYVCVCVCTHTHTHTHEASRQYGIRP